MDDSLGKHPPGKVNQQTDAIVWCTYPWISSHNCQHKEMRDNTVCWRKSLNGNDCSALIIWKNWLLCLSFAAMTWSSLSILCPVISTTHRMEKQAHTGWLRIIMRVIVVVTNVWEKTEPLLDVIERLEKLSIGILWDCAFEGLPVFVFGFACLVFFLLCHPCICHICDGGRIADSESSWHYVQWS